MARIKRRLFFTPVDSTPETVFTNTNGYVTTLESISLAQPSSALATVIRLSIGVDATATRVIEYPIPAGTGTFIFYPNLVLTGTEVFQLSSTVTDDVVIATGNGYSDLVAP